MDYVDLIIDNSSDQTDRLYTYGTLLPGLVPGSRVTVPFARGNRKRIAYVHSQTEDPGREIPNLKYVEEKDADISLPPDGIPVVDWMRQRYFCRRIDGVKCFTPAGGPPKRKRTLTKLFGIGMPPRDDPPELTQEQQDAMEEILPSLTRREHRVFLLHGVTSSGKTEVYLRVIGACIAQGRTAIMLVPEIALTTQTIQRFMARFGVEVLGVLHSRLSLGERYDQWIRAKRGEIPIVIGARSAVFAPLENIGAIIIDEEHETTYKSDMTPKYDTIEVAIQRAIASDAVVILGSATPSLESMYYSQERAYHKIRMEERFNQTPLPAIEVIDMREELLQGNKSMFSRELYAAIQKEREEGRQVILFLNRRGYSTFLSCRSCGYVMRCSSCGISRTYHKAEDKAICHYCGDRKDIPKKCPSCGSSYIRHFGTGTEKVEELTQNTFPDARIARLDMDTTKRKGSADRILASFEQRETDILIGTQLVAKGLDFANVGLVGIVAADISLNIPDYRSAERTFQLITQAAGRAGRGNEIGRVVIQTYTPDHYAIQAAAEQDHQGFYRQELNLRRQIGYPPFSDLIRLVLSAEEEEPVSEGIEKIRRILLGKIGKTRGINILGPRPAPIPKVNDRYRYQLLLKVYPGEWELYQKALWDVKKKVTREKKKEWTLSIDVNPFGFL